MTTTSTHKQRQQELYGEHERRTTSSPAERLQSPPPSRDADRCPTPDSASMAARKRGHGWRAERRKGGGASLVGGRRQRRRAVDLEEDVVVVAVTMGRRRLAGSGGGGGGGGGMACTGDLTVGDRSNGQDSFPPAFFKKEPLLPLPLLTVHIFFTNTPAFCFQKGPLSHLIEGRYFSYFCCFSLKLIHFYLCCAWTKLIDR